MKTQAKNTLMGLAALLAAGISAQARYAFTNIDVPAAMATSANGISGSNIVGSYADANRVNHGFFSNGITFVTLDAPWAGSNAGQGTFPNAIDGTNIVGYYVDPGGFNHGFLRSGTNWTRLNNPSAGSGSGQGTFANGVDGTNIVGTYYDGNNVLHGFLLSGTNWTTLDDPSAGSETGTFANGISGANIVGGYYDRNGGLHGLLYNHDAYTTVDDPAVGLNPGPGFGTYLTSISGSDIVGVYKFNSGNPLNGFGLLYSMITSNWTQLYDPLGTNGTNPEGISGPMIVGTCWDNGGDRGHGFVATPAPAPALAMIHSGNILKITWPFWNSGGWALEQNGDPSTTNWTSSRLHISSDGTNNSITLGWPPGGNQFFRLRQP